METIYDWVTVGIFAGLIVLFLQRSSVDEPQDSIWLYLVAAVGCAVANYLGNEGQQIPAVLVIVGTLSYVAIVLKPFSNPGPS
jgi:peptidoglycan/LPS O-acetylase OafA/YrhL